jgi:hypothetical protein
MQVLPAPNGPLPPRSVPCLTPIAASRVSTRPSGVESRASLSLNPATLLIAIDSVSKNRSVSGVLVFSRLPVPPGRSSSPRWVLVARQHLAQTQQPPDAIRLPQVFPGKPAECPSEVALRG